jgi:type I restriction enzyme M protein
MVVPDGVLSNPGSVYIRSWLLRHCQILASVDLPVEVFIAEANVNILTSLLFLRRKTSTEIQASDLGPEPDYSIFMAVAETVGFGRRGNTLYKRGPDGRELWHEEKEIEKVRIGGRQVVRELTRQRRVVDDDLPAIGKAYAEFVNGRGN